MKIDDKSINPKKCRKKGERDLEISGWIGFGTGRDILPIPGLSDSTELARKLEMTVSGVGYAAKRGE